MSGRVGTDGCQGDRDTGTAPTSQQVQLRAEVLRVQHQGLLPLQPLELRLHLLPLPRRGLRLRAAQQPPVRLHLRARGPPSAPLLALRPSISPSSVLDPTAPIMVSSSPLSLTHLRLHRAALGVQIPHLAVE